MGGSVGGVVCRVSTHYPRVIAGTRGASASVGLTRDWTLGVQVMPFELLMASILDVDGDGVLTDEEKVHAAALIDRFKKHYVMGLDVRHPMFGSRVLVPLPLGGC